jgi:hypothetical protein
MDIVKVLVPDAYKLKKIRGGGYKSIIVDEELDPFEVHFNGDGCMEINTEGMTYITLSIDTLHDMLYLLEEAELKLSKQRKICEI